MMNHAALNMYLVPPLNNYHIILLTVNVLLYNIRCSGRGTSEANWVASECQLE